MKIKAEKLREVADDAKRIDDIDRFREMFQADNRDKFSVVVWYLEQPNNIERSIKINQDTLHGDIGALYEFLNSCTRRLKSRLSKSGFDITD